MKSPRARDWAVFRVNPGDLERVWPSIERGLKRTFKRVETDLTTNLLMEAGKAGKVSFWSIVDDDWTVCGSISVAHLPDGTGDILTLSGEQGLDWVPTLFERWADMLRALGLRRLTFTGRRGWKHVLVPLGFEAEPDDGGLVIMNRAL